MACKGRIVHAHDLPSCKDQGFIDLEDQLGTHTLTRSAMLDMVCFLIYVKGVLARQASAFIAPATITAYAIRATAMAVKRVGRPPAYQRMAIQPPPVAITRRAIPARRGHSNRPAPC